MKELLKKEDVTAEELDKKVGEFSDSLQKIGQAAYQAQKPPEGAENASKATEEAKGEKKAGDTKEEPKVEEGEVVE